MRKLILPALILLCFIFVCLRFVQLDADPPIALAQYGQSALTDPYLYTWHARQATLFPADQQIEYARFSPLKYTTISAAARIVFSVAGVSRITANVASILLSLCGIFLWLFALRNYWSWERVITVGFLLLSNFILLTYNRMPYLENGLLFFFGLTFFVYARWGQRPVGQILTGVAFAGAALFGKVFGVLLIVPIVATQICFLRSRSIRPIGLTLVGGLFAFGAYLLFFMGGDFAFWWQYHLDTTELLRVSKYISDPLGPLGMFLSFGGEGGLTLFGIGTVMIACTGSIVWLASRDILKLTRENLPVLFSLVWLIVTLLVFFPFEYRPLRYLIVAILPALALFVPLIDWWQGKLSLVLKPVWLAVPLIFLIILYLANQIISYGANLAHTFIGFKTVLPYCLAGAVAVVLSLLIIRFRGRGELPIIAIRLLIILIAAFYVVTNGRDLYAAYSDPRYDLKTLNREISEIIDPSVLVTGSYAPALTIDNDLNGVFNYLGTVRHDPTFFRDYNPTHLFTNSGDWAEVDKDYHGLAGAFTIAEPILWSYHLQFIALRKAKYTATLFEQAYFQNALGHEDSARLLLDAFDLAHPHNRLSSTLRVNIYAILYRNSDSAITLVDRLLTEYPDDYYITAFAAIAYKTARLEQKSRDCLAKCNRLNPFARPRLQ